ncbi:MAG: ABC transporter ATP-binding protein [Synergistaceae bacterium]|nr:ABC transporter ATP-binding protein [Synergistaceae bacterium]MBQ9628148.1 ABC transporter ATP-binding protein [Synergistaceae bacterium]
MNNIHDKTPLKFLLSYTRPHYLKIFLAMIFMLASSGLNILPPYLFKSIVDDVLISKNIFMLNIICVTVFIIFGLKAVTTYFQKYLMNVAGQSVVMDIRRDLYDHMQRMSLKKIYSSRIGELMSRITGDVATLQSIVTGTIVDMLFNLVTFIGMFAFILYINWKLTCLIILVLPVVAYLLSFAAKRLRKAAHNVQEHLADITATAQEAFSAIRVVRSFATEDEELERFSKANHENYDALLNAVSVQGISAGVIEVFLIFALSIIFWFGGNSVINGALTPGELISFTGYIAFMVQPIRSVMNQMGIVQTGIASTERIFDMLKSPIEDNSLNDGGIKSVRFKGNVEFEHVSFSYESGQSILKDINLNVKAGERIAIVGPTGSGKSTLVDLIPRFYDPDNGRILIDGHDIRELSLKDLRRQIGIVPQECVLMRGTIAFNIAYGLEEQNMNRIIEAAEIADIRTFIESLPDKYESEVGERGVTLSGGQRQRIAIARAVIRDPRILILDEATSSLDIAVERQVQKAINQAMKGRTSFIIAHRLTTIRSADRILVLENGKFTQSGTHEELMRAGGLYSELYNMQFGIE